MKVFLTVTNSQGCQTLLDLIIAEGGDQIAEVATLTALQGQYLTITQAEDLISRAFAFDGDIVTAQAENSIYCLKIEEYK